MSVEPFKIIIVGGSITGLTLAHSLHRIGVDFIVLEKRSEIVLQEGASIGILPNGARILDQLGLYTLIKQATGSLGASDLYFPDGFRFRSLYPTRVFETFGYPISFMERRRLLGILYAALPDKTKIKTGQHVISVETEARGEKGPIRVRTMDGDVYDGDLVVGADGVHSRIRDEMWRLLGPEMAARGREAISAEYSCCFGISDGVAELEAGEQMMRLDDGRALLVIPSRDQVVYWLCTQKLDRRYAYGEIPRFTAQQAEALCSQLADTALTETLCFGHVWERRKSYNMVAMEEYLLPKWSSGRIVCIGDSAHKMTVNFGQGANSAMEDAAALTNHIYTSLLQQGVTKPTDEQMTKLLHRLQERQMPRISRIAGASWAAARVHARDGFVFKLVGRYLMPSRVWGGLVDARAFGLMADATALDMLSLPLGLGPGWNKYADKGKGKGTFSYMYAYM
ncbi:FAD binding domain-containing protein [Ophiocordyceps camponoti-floridani]|uniref:FAD binding domain-containing protein n=1 Tax=Ophiocordyceps camponoti-floridani TaxID=2030778 RepID=A0A8H4QA13_9HYPO|nr:FAD binding domain-containing protein [Ophiocordyceps camponoti-floridani]